VPEAELKIEGIAGERLVRKGESSELYRGVQQQFQRSVAIKLFTGGGVKDAALKRFDEETAAMGTLSKHPSVVTFFHAGIRRNRPYVVTEWLDDGSFHELIADEGPLDWRRMVDIGVKLAGALESAHRAGIHHGKLKPQDVFVSPFGEPLLGDFQLDPSEERRGGDPFDVLVHAAPERIEGDVIDARSDIYALASTLFTLLLGRPPFQHEDDEPLVRIKGRAATEEPPSLDRSELPDVVWGVLRWALRPDSGERPRTALDFGRALQAAQLAVGERKSPIQVVPWTDEDRALPEPSVPAAALTAVVSSLTRTTQIDEASLQAMLARTSPEALLADVRSVLEEASKAYAASPDALERVAALRARISEPLRVAIAGLVKAGKSTLLNGLVGEELAPTDAGECTKIVTWYRDGITYRATLHPKDGEPRQTAFRRESGALDIDLGKLSADDIDRIVIDWPSSTLAEITLIDTPGIGSISTDVSQRTLEFLTPDAGGQGEADAVIYLMRNFHPADARFLEAFHDDALARPSPINSIGILSRADELAGGQPGAMDDARRVADRYRRDVQIRRLCQTVVPVAGLLAQAGGNLRQSEYDLLSRLAQLPEDDRNLLLASVDRFTAGDVVAGVTSSDRSALVRRLGLYGVSFSMSLIASGEVEDASELARALVRHSGLVELRELLITQFAARTDVLKAWSALHALERLMREEPPAADSKLSFEIERVRTNAHLVSEIQLFTSLRSGIIELTEAELPEAERLLGADGFSPWERLGLDPEAGSEDIEQAALDAIKRWQTRREHPLTSQDVRTAASRLVQTCEGILLGVTAARS